MKTLRNHFILAGILLSAISSPLLAKPADFEGRIKMQMTSGKNTQVINYAVKKHLMRTDIPMEGESTITSISDFEKKEMITLMPAERMYIVMAMPQGDEMAPKKKNRSGREATFEKTTETEKILGYLCTKFISTDEDGNAYEIWAAEGLGTFMSGGGNPMNKKRAPRSAWEAELAKNGFFPLRTVGKNEKGKEIFRMEALAVEKEKLPDSVFAVPEDYQRFDMGNMMKGMANPFGR